MEQQPNIDQPRTAIEAGTDQPPLASGAAINPPEFVPHPVAVEEAADNVPQAERRAVSNAQQQLTIGLTNMHVLIGAQDDSGIDGLARNQSQRDVFNRTPLGRRLRTTVWMCNYKPPFMAAYYHVAEDREQTLCRHPAQVYRGFISRLLGGCFRIQPILGRQL